ncbi:MAG: hypothetical protein HY907_01030 [Deltaproteobacteria bacterium]|nr:hypothetical protein [Deltaproteobacteria bacterium]
MAVQTRGRAAIKFAFWTLAAGGVIGVVVHSFVSGQMESWYYHRAASDGYAVNADSFHDATKERPASLEIADVKEITGLQAVPVKKGDLLPRWANGVISSKEVKDGKRVALVAGRLEVRVPWQIKSAKGFKYKDTFKHKGIETYPGGAVWNVVIVLLLGVTLGYMAEGFTDLLGLKIKRLQHHVGH